MSKISLELQNAYQEAYYKVFVQKKEIVLRVGKNSTEMNRLLQELGFSKYAFLTAANPYSLLKSIEENRARNLELEKIFVDKKIPYLVGCGESGDGKWKEESFCVFGIDLRIAQILAKQFKQNAFMYGMKNKVPEIIWCK